MLGYVTVGTNDLERAAAFYDAIAKEMGVGRMMEFPTFIAWGEMDAIACTKSRSKTAAVTKAPRARAGMRTRTGWCSTPAISAIPTATS